MRIAEIKSETCCLRKQEQEQGHQVRQEEQEEQEKEKVPELLLQSKSLQEQVQKQAQEL